MIGEKVVLTNGGIIVITFTDGESEAYVSFRAFLSSGVLTEKSRFLKEKGKWLYVSGEISQSER